jgi:para-nitrobenzyl esterase
VSTPKTRAKTLLPVLFWIHGGGFHSSSGPSLVGDGSQFARAGIVVVTFNYRLGALGFLHLGELLGPDYASSGCCGLQDQIAALRWVRENIDAFGGDPEKITIAGNSAGAKSVGALLAAPSAKGLFRRAISQSGGQHVAETDVAAVQAERFFQATGLSKKSAAALLDLPPEAILSAQVSLGTGVKASWLWRPTVDGIVLPAAPLAAIRDGSAKGVELMAGTNANEATTYDVLDPSAAEQAPRVIQSIFDEDAAAFWDVYRRARPESDKRAIWQAVMGDERYVIPTIRLLDAQSQYGAVWRYRFDCQGHLPSEFKAGHGTEMPFVFMLGTEELQHSRRLVAQQMHAAWARFIGGESPSAEGLPDWPCYTPLDRQTMIFDEAPLVLSDPHAEERDQWLGKTLPENTWWTEDQLA